MRILSLCLSISIDRTSHKPTFKYKKNVKRSADFFHDEHPHMLIYIRTQMNACACSINDLLIPTFFLWCICFAITVIIPYCKTNDVRTLISVSLNLLCVTLTRIRNLISVWHFLIAKLNVVEENARAHTHVYDSKEITSKEKYKGDINDRWWSDMLLFCFA